MKFRLSFLRSIAIMAAVIFAVAAIGGSVWCLAQSDVVVEQIEQSSRSGELDAFLDSTTAQRDDVNSDDVLYEGIIIWTECIKTGPVDFMSHDIWKAKIYVGNGKTEDVIVTDSGGAWEIATRIKIGDYVVVVKPLNIYNEYNQRAILAVLSGAVAP